MNDTSRPPDHCSSARLKSIRALGNIGDQHAVRPLMEIVKRIDKGFSIEGLTLPEHARYALRKIMGRKANAGDTI